MKITDKYVFFWKEHPMCNFTKCKIKLINPKEKLEFTSSEQLFMYFKAKFFSDAETAQKILNAETPEEARKLGRTVKNYNDKAWDKVRVGFMNHALKLKFTQNEDLKKKLLDPKFDGKTFVEAAYYDRIWGIGFNEIEAENNENKWGRNELGKLLTELRKELKIL